MEVANICHSMSENVHKNLTSIDAKNPTNIEIDNDPNKPVPVSLSQKTEEISFEDLESLLNDLVLEHTDDGEGDEEGDDNVDDYDLEIIDNYKGETFISRPRCSYYELDNISPDEYIHSPWKQKGIILKNTPDCLNLSNQKTFTCLLITCKEQVEVSTDADPYYFLCLEHRAEAKKRFPE